MNWVYVALTSTTLFAIVTVLDKRLIVHHFPSARVFTLAFGLIQAPVALVFFLIAWAVGVPWEDFSNPAGLAWALASGGLWAVALLLFFYGLALEEVSRATPIQMTAPIYAALVAVLFFGESLSPAQWAAVLAVVGGAGLVSMRPGQGIFEVARGRALAVLTGAAMLMGLAHVASKEATDFMAPLPIQGVRAIGMGIGVVALIGRGPALRILMGLARNGAAMRMLVLTEGIMAPLAALLFVVAVSLGPVSVVSAVTSVRPLVVLALTLVLSKMGSSLLSEPLDRRTVALKTFSTALIVGGVAALALL
ncbi:MAG: DMT family transporter [Chloroflexota bacterium]